MVAFVKKNLGLRLFKVQGRNANDNSDHIEALKKNSEQTEALKKSNKAKIPDQKLQQKTATRQKTVPKNIYQGQHGLLGRRRIADDKSEQKPSHIRSTCW